VPEPPPSRRRLRSLHRDNIDFRDAPMIYIATEDRYAVSQYFSFLHLPWVQVHVLTPGEEAISGQTALDTLKQTSTEPGDQRWLLLDTDRHAEAEHLRSFTSILQQARQSGIEVALSKPCFEFWLWLHWGDPIPANRCQSAQEALREAIGTYNKTNLRPEHWPLERVFAACHRARALDEATTGGDIPVAPSTRVYKLIESIAHAASLRRITEPWQSFRAARIER